MKLEMGESLVFSWLRHEQCCQIVQTNWKVSPEWDKMVDNKELNKLFKESNIRFGFVSKKVRDAEQLINQGEVDVIGIELNTDSSLCTIKKIHAVDVAFHENGLNYGGVEETKHRIMKKYIRAALSIYEFFGCKDADIYFVTPYTRELHRKKYVEATKTVEDFFKEKGFSFSFHFYTNEDFYRNIFVPVERNSTITADTSELLVRSLKLIRLMEKGYKQDADFEEEISYSLPIGKLVRACFNHLSKHQLLSDRVIKKLQKENYSEDTFNLSYPALKLIDDEDESQRYDSYGYARYYVTPYSFNGKEYYLCNDWYKKNKANFTEWYNRIIETHPKNV
jgi:hypothetical protein